MSIALKSFPSANIQGNPANKSYWVAVHHPVVFTFQRKDFSIVNVTDSGSNTAFVNMANQAAMVEGVVGDYIYIETTNGVIAGTYQIISKASSVFINYYEIAHPMTGTVTGGWLNYSSARKNYFIETVVYSLDDSFHETLIGTNVNVCSPSGIITTNIMEYLKSLVSYEETFSFDEVTAPDPTLGGKYNIAFFENYNTTRIGYGSLDYLGDKNFVNATKQVQDEYGTNMAAYVPSLLYEEGKFLSDFVAPTYFKDLPFALTFIMSDKICYVFNIDYFGINNLRKVEIYFDKGGSATGFIDINIFDATSTENVNRLMLGESFPANTDYALVSLAYDDGVVTDHRLTEQKKVKINSSCENANPVYLNWLGTNGGRNFWLFDTMQEDVLEVVSEGEFTPQTIDLATDLGNGEYTGKGATPELVCHAYLELADIRGLKGLLMSPDVLMLTNPETWATDNPTSPPSPLPKWKRVKVLPQTYKVLSTNSTHAEIELTLLLPTINIQTQ
ncbi:MAG: hypothetical protein V4549_18140 [Bacteroidota bacterium]